MQVYLKMDENELHKIYNYHFFGAWTNFGNTFYSFKSGKRYTNYTYNEFNTLVKGYKRNVKQMCKDGPPPDFNIRRKNMKGEKEDGSEWKTKEG
jgi:hypothetical protein